MTQDSVFKIADQPVPWLAAGNYVRKSVKKYMGKIPD
jgi:hypothetical protein